MSCDVTGKPNVQSVVQLDSHMQQEEGDLIGRLLDALSTGKVAVVHVSVMSLSTINICMQYTLND